MNARPINSVTSHTATASTDAEPTDGDLFATLIAEPDTDTGEPTQSEPDPPTPTITQPATWTPPPNTITAGPGDGSPTGDDLGDSTAPATDLISESAMELGAQPSHSFDVTQETQAAPDAAVGNLTAGSADVIAGAGVPATLTPSASPVAGTPQAVPVTTPVPLPVDAGTAVTGLQTDVEVSATVNTEPVDAPMSVPASDSTAVETTPDVPVADGEAEAPALPLAGQNTGGQKNPAGLDARPSAPLFPGTAPFTNSTEATPTLETADTATSASARLTDGEPVGSITTARAALLAHRPTADAPARIVLRMDPPDLGNLTITMRQDGNHMHVNVAAPASLSATQLLVLREAAMAAAAAAGTELGSFTSDTGASHSDHTEQRTAHPTRPHAYLTIDDTPAPVTAETAVGGPVRWL